MTSATFVGKVDERTGMRIDGSAVRILLDIEARSDGVVRVTRLYTDRLAPIRHDMSLLRSMDNEVRTRLNGRTGDAATWADLYSASHVRVTNAVDQLLRPRWPGKPRNVQVPVELSYRLLNLNPQALAPVDAFPWLEVVALDEAVARAAKNLKPGDVKINLYGSNLSLDDGGDRLRLGVRVPVEALISKVALSPKDDSSQVLVRSDVAAFLARDRMNSVLDLRLPASALWRLSAQPAGPTTTAEIWARFRGMEKKPVRVEIPCGDLGRPDTLVDVFLDLGSTTTKYIVRVGDKLSTPQAKRTARLAVEWSLPRYEKAKLLADVTGAEWSRWVAELLPALRRYAAREHRGHLRSVHLTVPQSGPLDVTALARVLSSRMTESTAVPTDLDLDAIRVLNERAAFDAVGFETLGRVVVLTPEHEAVARHYLAPLKVLHQAATQYQQSYLKRAAERNSQEEQKREWDRKRAELMEYEGSNFIYRLFSTKPAGPTGARPSVASAFESPADWMLRLVARPELLDRVVLLDAGGLSLDMAVLKYNALVPACSKSDAACGGEALTLKLAELLGGASLSSEDGTREKARLGDLWANPANVSEVQSDERCRRFGGRSQRAYREATRIVYLAAIRDLANVIGGMWRGGRSLRCTIILTGGASRNPHFQELIAEQLAGAGLEADVVDARAVHNLLEEARQFEHPLPELASPPVFLFSTVHGWALKEVHGSERMVYDKYAVVGGLLAGAQRS